MRLELGRRPEVHGAEAAGVVEGDPRPAVEVEHDVVVLGGGREDVVEDADGRAPCPGGECRGFGQADEQPARHAEMHDQRVAAVEVGEKILRAPPEAEDPRPGQPRAEARRQRPAQVRAADVGGEDGAAGHDGLEAAAHRLHLRQLGHPSVPPSSHPVACPAFRLISRGAGTRKSGAARARQMSESREGRTASFGFEEVSEAEKAERVRGVFASVARRYDLMNDAMSGGVHRLWKAAMVDWLAPRPGLRCSTSLAARATSPSASSTGRAGRAAVTVLDLTEAMLMEGRRRAEATRHAGAIDWVVGDAMALPFRDAAFDAYTIAFGIRNVANIPQALAEARRVLRPGGRLMVLEFSRVPNALLRSAYDAYSFNAIPAMGGMIAGDRESYRYLVESIRRFPDQEAFAGMIGDAGFERVSYRNLSFGIAALHSAWVL
jgi:demethylmenaquinone methyltransferase / 2-methoxy-6-polyprenyl-1,4-benzoquinol methylase